MTAPRIKLPPARVTLPDLPLAIPSAERDETAPRRRGLLSSRPAASATVSSVIAAIRAERDSWREDRA